MFIITYIFKTHFLCYCNIYEINFPNFTNCEFLASILNTLTPRIIQCQESCSTNCDLTFFPSLSTSIKWRSNKSVAIFIGLYKLYMMINIPNILLI